jgi:hypothetical protein
MRTFTMIVFKAIVEKKTEKKKKISVFRIGPVNMLDTSIFRG